MNDKIIIVGISDIDKLEIAKELVRRDDNLSIASHFTTDNEIIEQYGDNAESIINDKYIQYIKNDIINLAYKNNSLLYVITNGYISEGITTDEYYNSDIIYVDILQFNQIPDRFFNSKYSKNIIVWVDTRNHRHISQSELIEIRYLQERLDAMSYLYFLDESIDKICTTILEYLEADEDKRKQIIEENL